MNRGLTSWTTPILLSISPWGECAVQEQGSPQAVPFPEPLCETSSTSASAPPFLKRHETQVTQFKKDFGSAVFAELPVGDDVGRDFAVAVHALRRARRLREQGAGNENERNEADENSPGLGESGSHKRLRQTRNYLPSNRQLAVTCVTPATSIRGLIGGNPLRERCTDPGARDGEQRPPHEHDHVCRRGLYFARVAEADRGEHQRPDHEDVESGSQAVQEDPIRGV